MMTINLTPMKESYPVTRGYALLLISLLTVWLLAGATAKAQVLQGSQFSYQGQLKFSGQAVNDTFTQSQTPEVGMMIDVTSGNVPFLCESG